MGTDDGENFTDSSESKMLQRSFQIFCVVPAVISSTGQSIRANVAAWRQADRDKEIQAWKLQSGIEDRVNSSVPEIKEMENSLIADQGQTHLSLQLKRKLNTLDIQMFPIGGKEYAGRLSIATTVVSRRTFSGFHSLRILACLRPVGY